MAVRGEAYSLPASPGAPERSGGPGTGGRPPPRPGARPLAPACPPDCGRRRRCRESACCGTHCECLTMRGTGAHGAEGPWPDFGIPKTGPRAAELENGAWGTGRDSEGGLQTWGQDLEKGKLSARTRGTEKGKTRGIRREVGDMRSGQGLREAGSRVGKPLPESAPESGGAGPTAKEPKGLARPWPVGAAGGGRPARRQLAVPNTPRLGLRLQGPGAGVR